MTLSSRLSALGFSLVLLTTPLPFDEAIASAAVRSLLPTELRTDFLSTLRPEVLARAKFSAGITQAELLQRGFDGVAKIAAGTSDRATQRLQLRDLAIALGYTPPAGEAGTLADFTTEGRLNLFLDTNVKLMQGAGRYLQGQDPAILDQWPANELVRVRDSKEPRDWETRFRDACDEAGDDRALAAFESTGRMVALKNSRVWVLLSRFGQPFAPYDFNSGMGDQDVDRDDAIDLGLIDRDTQIPPDGLDINADLQATPEVRDAALKTELETALDGIAEFVGGVLKML